MAVWPPYLLGSGCSVIHSLEQPDTLQVPVVGKRNRTEQNRTEQNRTEQNRTEQNITDQNRTEQNRTELTEQKGERIRHADADADADADAIHTPWAAGRFCISYVGGGVVCVCVLLCCRGVVVLSCAGSVLLCGDVGSGCECLLVVGDE